MTVTSTLSVGRQVLDVSSDVICELAEECNVTAAVHIFGNFCSHAFPTLLFVSDSEVKHSCSHSSFILCLQCRQ